MATTAFFSGRVGAFVSSGGLLRHGGITRMAARSLTMAAAGEEKVGFIGERPGWGDVHDLAAPLFEGLTMTRWMKSDDGHCSSEPHERKRVPCARFARSL